MNKPIERDDLERRITVDAKFEVRQDGDNPPVLVGYAAVFNQLSDDLYGFRERIVPGAFNASTNSDIRALFNHDPNIILGRTTSGTLKVMEDSHGLKVEIMPPDTQVARDLITSMRRGDIDQMSFGFRTRNDLWEDDGGEAIRTLLEVDLFDVSPVTFPAYPQTDIAVRSMNAWRESKKPATTDFTIQRRRLDLAELE